jgi:hypothetical protein
MGWFFTQAALVTFGGAYAVLPYVLPGAVEDYGWVTAAQMIDGLALGETTPGPLIMVVAFVGSWAAGARCRWAPTPCCSRAWRAPRRDLLHVPAVVPLHPRGRPAGGAHARDVKLTAPSPRSPRRSWA